MQPKLELLPQELIERILDEAFQLLLKPGIKVQSAEARELLASAGAQVQDEIVAIPEALVRQALQTVPHTFYLHDRDGNPAVTYGGDAVHFDPGSSGVHMLDPETLEHYPSQSDDLVRLVKVAEMLPQYDAQSTAVVCNEVPKAIGDLYRLYLVLLHSKKPIVTGSFSRRDAAAHARHAGHFRRRGGWLARQTPGGLRCLPVPAADLEPLRRPEPDGSGPCRRARPDGLHAAGRRRLAGHPARLGRAARRREPVRHRSSTNWPSPARPSCGAARPPSSTCATAPPPWAPSRPP